MTSFELREYLQMGLAGHRNVPVHYVLSKKFVIKLMYSYLQQLVVALLPPTDEDFKNFNVRLELLARCWHRRLYATYNFL